MSEAHIRSTQPSQLLRPRKLAHGAPVSCILILHVVNCRYQAITRFDRWSLSVRRIFHQLALEDSVQSSSRTLNRCEAVMLRHSPGLEGTRSFIRTALCLVILLVMPHGARADVGAPDTPAGHTLQAFLDAFNSADHDRIAVYVKEYDPQTGADGLTSFSNQTGGFTLVSIVHTAPDKLSFLVHGRGDNIDAFGILQLASTSPPHVKYLSIRAIPPGAKPEDIQLDEAIRQKTIDAMSDRLTDYYVYPEVAAKMVQAIHDHQKHGDYRSMTDGFEFADALATDLRAVSHDQHLHVSYDPFIVPGETGSPAGPKQPDPAEEARFRSTLERQNCTSRSLKFSITILATSSSARFLLQISVDPRSWPQ
jgi:N-terminal domain of Peptidase_S41 in eukaryotic IRBP